MSQTTTSEDPSLEHYFRGHKSIVTSVAFNPNGKQLASSSNDHSIVLWNLCSNTARCYNFIGHSDVVTSVDYSPTGQLLASASQDRTVRLWVPTIQGKCSKFIAHSTSVRSVSFSHDGQKLITGSNDKSIKIWQVTRNKFLHSFSGHTNWVRCAKFSPESDQIAASCADDRTLRLWDSRLAKSVHTFPHLKGTTNKLSFHPSGSAIAVALSYGAVRVYDLTANKLRQNYSLHENSTCVEWHPNGKFLLTSSDEGVMIIIDVLEGRPLYTLKGHQSSVNSVRFSNDGEYFASGSSDRHVMVWKTNFISSIPEAESSISLKDLTIS